MHDTAPRAIRGILLAKTKHKRARLACVHGHLRGLGCLCLVCLEFLASFHLHGAVDDPIGSQRLQPLHFHDHHLGSADITAICCSPAVIHPAHGGQSVKRENLERTRCCQIPPPRSTSHTHSASATVAMHTPVFIRPPCTLVVI